MTPVVLAFSLRSLKKTGMFARIRSLQSTMFYLEKILKFTWREIKVEKFLKLCKEMFKMKFLFMESAEKELLIQVK